MGGSPERAFIQRLERLHLLDGALHALVGAVEEQGIALAVLGDVLHAVEPHGEEHDAGGRVAGLQGFAGVGETFGDLLAEAGVAGAFELGGFFFGLRLHAEGSGAASRARFEQARRLRVVGHGLQPVQSFQD